MPPAKFTQSFSCLLLFVDNNLTIWQNNSCSRTAIILPYSKVSIGRGAEFAAIFPSKQIVIIVAVNIQVRQHGNGVGNVVNATLEASENFCKSMERRKDNLL